MAYIAKTDGTREAIPTPVTLEQAKKVLGGWVEKVTPRKSPGVVFLCNEEGLLKGLPLNAHGCELYGTEDHGAPIVGDIIVFESMKEAHNWVSPY